MNRKHQYYRAGFPIAALSAALIGCASPLDREATDKLRSSIVDSAQREVRHSEGHPEPRTVEKTPTELSFSPERMVDLEAMAGIGSYTDGIQTTETLGTDLLGTPAAETQTFRISLEQAVRSTAENNLSLQVAWLAPAISQSQVVAANAVFDWIFFADFDWTITDEPTAVPVVGGIPFGTPARQRQTVAYTTGIRKDLTSGGRFTATQGQTYTDDSTPGFTFFPNPANAAFASFRLDQPLLRGFGSDVALSEIRISQNIERDAIEALRITLLDAVTEAERAYWSLVRSRHTLKIQQRLLERGIDTRNVLESRLGVDARPAEYSDAVARVEQRKAAVIRAENSVRQASDLLKQLINDPDLNIGSEILLVPVDNPIEDPITFSLLESINTGLRNRPELQRAILSIDNASIRQLVARNSRLPLLNFAVEATLRGLATDVGDAYSEVGDGAFLNWLVSMAFEQPIGNRGAEALYRQRQLERLSFTLQYRQTVQQIVFEVKSSLRNVQTNYRLINQTRSSRLAASENLRTLEVLEETIASLTPDFLDLKLRRQEALAAAEVDELDSLINYNTSIADLHRSTGTALDRNQIRFVVPDAGDYLSESQ